MSTTTNPTTGGTAAPAEQPPAAPPDPLAEALTEFRAAVAEAMEALDAIRYRYGVRL